MLTLLLMSMAHAAYEVPRDGNLKNLCLTAEAGAVIEVEPGWSTTGGVGMDCERDAPITIRSTDSSERADVGGISLSAGADGSRLEHLRMGVGTANHLSLDGVKDIEVVDLELVGSAVPGIYLSQSSLAVDGLLARDFSDIGAAVLINNSSREQALTLKNCEFTGNGGIRTWRGTESATVHIEACRFHDMDFSALLSSRSALDLGGDVALTVVDSQFEDLKGSKGAAMYMSGGTLEVRGSSFYRNSAGEKGGALHLVGLETVKISRSHFEENESPWAGALYVQSSGQVDLEHDSFHFNRAGMSGVSGGPAAVYLTENDRSVVYGSRFCGNWTTISSFTGNHLRLQNVEQRVERNVFFLGDGEDLSGGVYSTTMSTRPEVWNNDFIGGSDPLGALVDHSLELDLRDNLFYDLDQGLSFADLTAASGYNAWIDVVFSTPGETDLELDDPGFLDFDSGNCDSVPYLAPDSPLIDAGSPDRFDPDGSRVDIGAWYYGAHLEPGDSGDSGEPGDSGDAGEERWEGAWISGGCRSGGGPRGLGVAALGILLAMARRRGGARGI